MSADSPLNATLECACKGVQIRIQGNPTFQVWCHCKDCRKWTQTSPFAAVIVPEETVTIVSGAELIGSLSLKKKELSRTFCKDCGFRLYNDLQGYAYKTFPAMSLEPFKYEPQAHIHCSDADPEALLRFKDDGLTKFSEFNSCHAAANSWRLRQNTSALRMVWSISGLKRDGLMAEYFVFACCKKLDQTTRKVHITYSGVPESSGKTFRLLSHHSSIFVLP